MSTNISNTANASLMKQARGSLQDKWGLAIGVTALGLVFGSCSEIPYIGGIVTIVLLPQIWVGISIFYLSISRNQDAQLGQLFETFSEGNN